ncbi:hypothetical protein [Paenibacillus sp.]|uniref:hypothetical protein n=1 Tax=Paenibacillus sp. TaxID=58172 RepID=UPI002D2E8790|nr:hypothetical protein [Paenibacillus sp.]HZG57683.1 hypothetical protein [Paenibacillus sp.]
MLDFERKLAVFASYPELTRKDVSLGRVNFHYEQSRHEKKTVGYHLHPNGNGYVYAGLIPGAETDPKGFVNIREASEAELRRWIEASIDSLRGEPSDDRTARPTADGASAGGASTGGASTGGASAGGARPDASAPARWTHPDGQTLLVTFEDELWYVFSGSNLEAAFETYEETEAYLREEGFARA